MSARLDSLAREARPNLVLDLRMVTFLDCAGVSLLCRLRNRALERGGRLRLVIVDPRFTRLLRMVRLEDAFEVVDDLALAVARSGEVSAGGSNGVIA
jgi:anti-sigma B factor antagonist